MVYFLIDLRTGKVVDTAQSYTELIKVKTANSSMVIDEDEARRLGYITEDMEE